MDEILKRDNNGQPVIGLVTDDANENIRMGRIDDATKGLKVILVGGVGAGNVVGPASSVTDDIATFADTTGKLIKDSGVKVTDLATKAGSLQLDQTVSQTIANGQPIQGTLVASQIVATDASKKFQTLDVTTYPSLTELSYVKGVTSGIQAQINAKGTGTVTAVSVATANGVSGSSSGGATPALTIALGAITPTTVNALTLASQAIGFTVAGGTTSKTLTVPLDASVSGTNTGDNAANSSSTYIGTTAVALNRASAALTLAGITLTTAELGSSTATTQSANDNSTKLATTAYADALKSATITLTNKRINPRLVTAASYTTDTGTSLDVSTCDQFEITAQAGALLFNAPGGTPLGGQKLIIRIKDNGTARALTYNAIFRAMGNALPTTTVISKTMYMGFIFNATDTKWDLVALTTEA